MFRTHLDAEDVWRLSGEQKLEFLRALETIGVLLAAAQAEVAMQAEDEGLHTQHNCRSLAVLLRNTLNLAPAEAKKRAKLAQGLPDLPKTREGLRQGVITGAHAVVIVNAVEHLPEEAVAKAEALLRDEGCAFPGCDRPPMWTEAHHVLHWTNGGPTSLDNMVLLCNHHHDVVHEGDWVITFNRGIPEFIPPRWVDPDQQPMRNFRLDPRLAIA